MFDDRLGRFLLLLGNLHFQLRDAILNRDWRLFWFPTALVVEGEVDGDGDYANKNNKRNDSTTHFALRCATQNAADRLFCSGAFMRRMVFSWRVRRDNLGCRVQVSATTTHDRHCCSTSLCDFR